MKNDPKKEINFAPSAKQVKSASPKPMNLKFNFYGATKRMMDGKKITRKVWGEDYALLHEGFLKLFTDNKIQNWIISREDVEAEDYMVKK